MASKKEQRKYERYRKAVPVRFSDVHRSIGETVNVSREGALIELVDGKSKGVSSFVKFRIYLDGILPSEEEKTTPNIDVAKMQAEADQIELRKQTDQKVVKIVGQVVRHEEGRSGNVLHGIHFLELDGDDMVRWLEFIGSVKKEIEVTRVGVRKPLENESTTIVDRKPGYTIRFKKVKTVGEFLPNQPEDMFFIPTPVQRDKNTVISLSIIHPANKSLLQFDLVVLSYAEDKKKKGRYGLYCRFHDLNQTLKHQINVFLGQARYA
jgi:hypothetical protein